MEKILTIDGRQVRFKSTAALPLRYKAQFGRELLADASAVLKCWHPGQEESEPGKGDSKPGYFSADLDISLVYNVIWALAKTADPSIKPPMEWFDDFDALPIFDWFADLSDLMLESFKGTRKN
jgi:hypothetical protein